MLWEKQVDLSNTRKETDLDRWPPVHRTLSYALLDLNSIFFLSFYAV